MNLAFKSQEKKSLIRNLNLPLIIFDIFIKAIKIISVFSAKFTFKNELKEN